MTTNLQATKRPLFIPVEPEAGRPTAHVAEERAATFRDEGLYALASFRAAEGGWGVRILRWA
jgi:hypothetical protein